MTDITKIASYFFITLSTVAILILGKAILIPFAFSLLLWIIIRELKNILDRVPFIKKRFPSWAKSILTALVIFILLSLTSTIITSSIESLNIRHDHYILNGLSIIKDMNHKFDIDLIVIWKDLAADFELGGLLSNVISSISDIMGNALIIIFYTLFVFLEESNFSKKIRLIFTNNDEHAKATKFLDEIEHSITKYLSLKTVVSLITGFVSYIILEIIGVDAAAFWAVLIFNFNYIPTIGSIAATFFPAIFCLFQFGDITPAIMVMVFVGLTQVFVGNFVEPKVMGNSLNISPLVTILALSFWGAVWGIIGMMISIPITVIIVIIFSHFEKTKPIAILLSEKGDIK